MGDDVVDYRLVGGAGKGGGVGWGLSALCPGAVCSHAAAFLASVVYAAVALVLVSREPAFSQR